MRQPRGTAALAVVKLIPIAVGGYLMMSYAFQQAEATGQGELWVAAAVIVPILIAFAGWAVRDSGNLRELIGRFNDHKEAAIKIADGQEAIYRELGGMKEFRLQVMQRLDQLDGDRAVQSKMRHEMRNEFLAYVGAIELKLAERDDKQDERLRAVERNVYRGTQEE